MYDKRKKPSVRYPALGRDRFAGLRPVFVFGIGGRCRHDDRLFVRYRIQGVRRYGRQTPLSDPDQKDGRYGRSQKQFLPYFESANEDKTLTKKFDFSIIGGPHYSSDTKLGLGLVAAGLYRTGKGDTLTPPSNVSLFGDITTTGFYLLGVRGNTLFEQSKYRLDFTAYFFSFPGAFWGIWYRDATYNQAESYKRLQNQIKVDFMFRVSKNFYLGVSPSFNYIEGRDFSNIDYLRGQKTRYINTGLAISFLTRGAAYTSSSSSGYSRVSSATTEPSRGPSFRATHTTGYGRAACWHTICTRCSITVARPGPCSRYSEARTGCEGITRDATATRR